MIEELMTTWAAALERASGGNEMIAGAITVWALGTLTYFAKGLPAALVSAIGRLFFTSVTLNNGGWHQEHVMYSLMRFLRPRMRESLSRTLTYEVSPEVGRLTLGVGYGLHMFVYKGRLFWIRRNKLESSGSERQKDEVTITTYGRSHKPFHDLLQDFFPAEDFGKVAIYHLDNEGDWVKYTRTPKRALDTVAISEDLKGEMIAQIEHFRHNRQWFEKRGMAYKLTYLIHGVPGGGKTTLIKALASYFDLNLCVININQVSDKTLERGLARVPAGSVVVIEDFDSSDAAKSRTQTVVTPDDSMAFQSLTLTGLLNALDGVVPLDDCILFLTTNHLEKIDPALYRKGRVDYLIEIGEVAAVDVARYAAKLYPEADFSGIQFGPALGCKLNEALLEAKDDPQRFIDSLIGSGVASRRAALRSVTA